MSYQAMKRLGNLNAYYEVKEGNLKITYCVTPTKMFWKRQTMETGKRSVVARGAGGGERERDE